MNTKIDEMIESVQKEFSSFEDYAENDWNKTARLSSNQGIAVYKNRYTKAYKTRFKTLFARWKRCTKKKERNKQEYYLTKNEILKEGIEKEEAKKRKLDSKIYQTKKVISTILNKGYYQKHPDKEIKIGIESNQKEGRYRFFALIGEKDSTEKLSEILRTKTDNIHGKFERSKPHIKVKGIGEASRRMITKAMVPSFDFKNDFKKLEKALSNIDNSNIDDETIQNINYIFRILNTAFETSEEDGHSLIEFIGLEKIAEEIALLDDFDNPDMFFENRSNIPPSVRQELISAIKDYKKHNID